MKKNIKQKTVIFFLILLVIGGSLFVLLKTDPEAVYLVSKDESFVLRGRLRNKETIKFKKRDDLKTSFQFSSSIYEINYGQSFLPRALSLTLKDESLKADFSSLSIYAYDINILAWRKQNSLIDFKEKTFTTEINRPFKLWTIAEKELLETEGKDDFSLALKQGMINELLAWPPEKAVGYQIYLSFSRNNQDFILLDDQLDRGGCRGIYQKGTSETLTSSEKKVGDIFYRLSVIWQLGDGCLKTEEIKSSYK